METVLLRRRAAIVPWPPRNPPPTKPSRQRPPATLCHLSLVKTAYAFYSYRHQPPMKAAKEVRHRRQPVRWRRSCCAGERRMGRGGPVTLPLHGRRASDRQRPVVIPTPPQRHSRERRPLHNHVISAPTPAVISAKAGIHGGARGGSPIQQQSKRHSPPKLPAGPPKQSIILFALSSFSIRKKRLNHHTKLNIQTRSGRPSRGLTPWPGEAYRAWWPGGRPIHRPGGD